MPPPWLATSCIMIAASVTPRPGAAVLGRHRDAEPAGFGHRAVELLRELAVVVAGEPVLVVERAHDGADAVADRPVVVADREIHGDVLRLRLLRPAAASVRSAWVRCGLSIIAPSRLRRAGVGLRRRRRSTMRRACASSASLGEYALVDGDDLVGVDGDAAAKAARRREARHAAARPPASRKSACSVSIAGTPAAAAAARQSELASV